MPKSQTQCANCKSYKVLEYSARIEFTYTAVFGALTILMGLTIVTQGVDGTPLIFLILIFPFLAVSLIKLIAGILKIGKTSYLCKACGFKFKKDDATQVSV